MYGVQLFQGYRATKIQQFSFYQSVPRSYYYSFNQPQKDERMSLSWNHPAVLNPGTPGLRIQHPNHCDNWKGVR